MSTDPVGAGPGAAEPLHPIVLRSSGESATALRAPPSPPPPGRDTAGAWLGRFFVRFGVAYLALFLTGHVLGFIPGLAPLAVAYNRIWRTVVPWVGKHVLRLDDPVRVTFTGSGDKLYDWVHVATLLGIAIVGALVWVWFDRARRADRWINEGVRIVVRYSLGGTMLSYGMAKILREQMPAPSMTRLLQPYGESSPMGLLWTFMGQSWAYSAFAGGMEFVGGGLLFFRRTTTLGALLLIAVMTNVLMMNLAFDVPVKLYSAHYLMFAIVLAAPDLRRLANVLFFHRATTPGSLVRAWPAGRAAKLLVIVKALIVVWILWLVPTQRVWRWVDRVAPAKSEFYGLYEVERFSRNGTDRPPLLTDVYRWRRVAIDEQGRMTIVLMSDARLNYRVRRESRGETITLEQVNMRTPLRETFTYSREDSGNLELKGRFQGDELSMRLRRADNRKLLLRERGFHWISEQPFNR